MRNSNRRFYTTLIYLDTLALARIVRRPQHFLKVQKTMQLRCTFLPGRHQ